MEIIGIGNKMYFEKNLPILFQNSVRFFSRSASLWNLSTSCLIVNSFFSFLGKILLKYLIKGSINKIGDKIKINIIVQK